jgi:type IV fimbrial biogenesis protein FimT
MSKQYIKHLVSVRAFTLIELIITIAIMAILLSMATMQFNQWQNKSKGEAQIRQMATDFSELRIRAMTTKQPHSITLNSNNYVFKAFTSAFTRYSSTSQLKVLPGGTRTVTYPLNKSSGTAYSGDEYEIDERGMNVNSEITIFLGGSASNGSVDCLTLHTVRVNIGKNSSGVCNDK